MTSVTKQFVVAALACAPLVFGCGGAAVSGDPDTPAGERFGAAKVVPRVVTQPESTAEGGLVLEVGKRVNGEVSSDLVVVYEWGGKKRRKAWVADAGTAWRVAFRDQPEPDEITTLELTYLFKMGEKDAPTLEKLVDEVLTSAIVAAYEASAAKADDFSTAFGRTSKGLRAKLEELDRFSDDKGRPASVVMMNELGVLRADDGALELTAGGRDKLVGHGETESRAEGWHQEEKKWWKKVEERRARAGPSSACHSAVNEAGRDATTPARIEIIRTCRARLVDLMENSMSEFSRRNPALVAERGPLTPEWAKLEQSRLRIETFADHTEAAVLGTESSAGGSTLGSELKVLRDAYAAVKDKENADGTRLPEPAYEPKESFEWAAVLWAQNRWGLSREQTAARKLANDVTHRVKTLRQQQVGSVLVERSGERRWFDFSTGAVYVGGVDDTIIPVLIAFCPFDGCLRKGETVYDPWPWGLFHSFSVDVGMRTATVDTTTDPRHLDRPAFLVGGSFNPIYFVRASWGLYAFENAQTENWNAAWYLGATVNVMHSAELLGVVGLGTPEFSAKGGEQEE